MDAGGEARGFDVETLVVRVRVLPLKMDKALSESSVLATVKMSGGEGVRPLQVS